MPASVTELDPALADFMNESFQEGDSPGYAGAAVLAPKRFLPDCGRFTMPPSPQLYPNWIKVYKPCRVTPVSRTSHGKPSSFDRAEATCQRFAHSVYFLSSNCRNLQCSPEPWHRGSRTAPSLTRPCKFVEPDSKTLLFSWALKKGHCCPMAVEEEVPLFHWQCSQNFEATVLMGRWADQKTCCIYLDEARALLVQQQLVVSSLPRLPFFVRQCQQLLLRGKRCARKATAPLVWGWGARRAAVQFHRLPASRG